jgi:hypothetical protein
MVVPNKAGRLQRGYEVVRTGSRSSSQHFGQSVIVSSGLAKSEISAGKIG